MKFKLHTVASWVTIVGFLIAIPGGIVGYFQLKDLFTPAEVELKFRNVAGNLEFGILNYSERTAEDPYYGFTIVDLSSTELKTLPVPYNVSTFIKPGQLQGFNEFMSKYGELGHNYAGTAMVTCRNCASVRRYFLYINGFKPEEGFYYLLPEKSDLFTKFLQSRDLGIFLVKNRHDFAD